MPHKTVLCVTIAFVCLSNGLALAAADGRTATVQSPNEKVRVSLEIADDGKNVLFSVERDGKPVVERSPIDIRLADSGSVTTGATIENVEERQVDESFDMPWGKTSRVHDHYRSASVRLKSQSGIEWDLELRAYNDGAAIRYGFPKQEKLNDFVLESETTQFRLADDPTVLYMTLDHFNTAHEALYQQQPLAQLPTEKLIAVPILATWPDGSAAAITEARLRDFAGMYLECPKGAKANILQSRLSPLPGKTAAAVTAKTPHWSPWRVIMLGASVGDVIESNLLVCLNDPPDGDFSWVKPGKTSFHWWNGEVEHGPTSTPESNFEIHKRYIDFCAANNIEYHSVISVAGNRPWHVQRDPGFAAPHPDTDITTARPEIDLPRILEYAKQKGVGIRFWVHWKPLSEHLEEAFAQYEKWGIKGLMVDFMDRDDQEMVEWQERVLQAAAKHKLHIQFHGSYKPTGEHRTYPNLVNREGVLNLEFLKWSDKCSPPHTVNVAYTRNLAGLTDYHLGGFRAAARDKFESRDLLPLMLGSRCNQLALYVVFENPMPMVADTPEAYEGQPGFDFITKVPTTWDETRFVTGEPGKYIVVARRSGKDWYLGGITDWNDREIEIPLDFLGDGAFEAISYLDDSLDGSEPDKLRQEKQNVTRAESLNVSLAPGGGVAAIFHAK